MIIQRLKSFVAISFKKLYLVIMKNFKQTHIIEETDLHLIKSKERNITNRF